MIDITGKKCQPPLRQNQKLRTQQPFAQLLSPLLTLLLLVQWQWWCYQPIPVQGANTTESPVADIVRQRGYIAETHRLNTADGYILSLVRVLNPLIEQGKQGLSNRRPILFVPGESANSAIFVVNSANAAPKDYSQYDANQMSVESLIRILSDDPSSHSLALLASSFGHEVWILDRRGTPGSHEHTNLGPDALKYLRTQKVGDTDKANSSRCNSTVPDSEPYDPNDELRVLFDDYQQAWVKNSYWNYTLDEQAKYDIPLAIDRVIQVTKSAQLSLVGHSTGSALTMMMLIVRPEMADKISNAIFWGPSFYQATTRTTAASRLKLNAIKPSLFYYNGPFSLSKATRQVQCLASKACQINYGKAACEGYESDPPLDGRVGNDDGLIRAAYMGQIGNPVSAKQSVQLIQNRLKGAMYFYDYENATLNSRRYGELHAPLYDVSKIKLETMSFWHGRSDNVATPEDIARLVGVLSATGTKVKVNFYDEPGLYIDHKSWLIHKEVASLIVIPCLKEIESY